MTPTMAEREAELAALQSAFDEYIASSRELEEELDAELAKMQEKLAESSAANAALSMQLENIAPQLTSLENSLTDSRRQWKEEQRMRRHAEQAQEMAEARLREVEGSTHQLQRENDALHEELAFKESEIEENKLEMEIEKEQLREELEEIRGDLIAKARQLQNNQQKNTNVSTSSNPEDDSFRTEPAEADSSNGGFADDAYAKKLEEELELVTEQLIETEKRLTTTEDKLRASETLVTRLETKQQQFDEVEDTEGKRNTELIKALQQENADHLEARHKMTEEYELAKQKLKLLENDLKAHEDHEGDLVKNADQVRADHREEIHKLKVALQEMEMEYKTAKSEVAVMEKTLQDSLQNNTTETFKLKEEIAHLNQALNNSKSDYQSLLDELEAVSSRFDEAVQEAEKTGREAATRSLRQEADSKAQQVKQELSNLREENETLQAKLDDAEISLGQVKDTQDKNIDNALAQTEMVKKLQQQLVKAKEDVAGKDKELSDMVSGLEERLNTAEEMVTSLESELNSTKGKLAEAESRMIVMRRERGTDTAAQSANRRKLDEYQTGDEEESRDDISRLQSRSFDTAEPRRLGRSRRRARSSSPCSVDRLGYRLTEESKKYKELQEEFEALKDQKRMGDARIKRLEEDVRVLQQEMTNSNAKTAGAVTQFARLSSLGAAEHGMDVMNEGEVGRDRLDDIIDSRDAGLMAEELRGLQHKCNAQREYNAQLLSKMLSLQGNIQVYCRVRPMTVSEIQRGYKGVVEALSETEVGCFDSRTNKWKSFAFDRVWGPDQSQQSIFQDVEPVALSVVDGYNACIFAYGQTGSGKTYTMEGIAEGNQHGISYRTIQKVFHLLNLRAQQQRASELIVGQPGEDPISEDGPGGSTVPGNGKSVSFTFELEVSMLEIYNDEIYDLFGAESSSMADKIEQAKAAGGKASLEIRKNKDGRIEVPNLARSSVKSIEDVMRELKKGNDNRATASTDMNEHSSRSHLVLIVHVNSGLDGVPSNRGCLYLVDLAGSERVRKSNVGGAELREAGYINKSLSALGNVMEALDRKSSHVPYRDSKLTYLLQDSLGGNSRTMMIVAVTPTDVTCDESVQALQFATRVRRIQIGAAQRNVTSKNLEETVKNLSQELKTLTSAKERSESQLLSLKRDNTRIQDRLQNLSQARQQTRSDTRTLDVLRKNNTDMAARWQKEKRMREETSEELEKLKKEFRRVQQLINKKSRDYEKLEQELQDKERKLDKMHHELRVAKDASSAASLRARRAQVLSARGRNVPGGGSSSTGSKVVDVLPARASGAAHGNDQTVKSGESDDAVITTSASAKSTSGGDSVVHALLSGPRASSPARRSGASPARARSPFGRGQSPMRASSPSRKPQAEVAGGAAPTGEGAGAVADDALDSGVDNRQQADQPEHDIVEIRSQVLALLEKHDKSKVNRIDIIMEKFKGKEHLLLQKMTQRYEGTGVAGSPAPSVQKRNELAMERHKERMRLIREKQNGGG